MSLWVTPNIQFLSIIRIVAYHLQYKEYGEGLTEFTLDTFCTANNKSYIEVENGEQGYI